jgi:hypothetical protein
MGARPGRGGSTPPDWPACAVGLEGADPGPGASRNGRRRGNNQYDNAKEKRGRLLVVGCQLSRGGRKWQRRRGGQQRESDIKRPLCGIYLELVHFALFTLPEGCVSARSENRLNRAATFQEYPSKMVGTFLLQPPQGGTSSSLAGGSETSPRFMRIPMGDSFSAKLSCGFTFSFLKCDERQFLLLASQQQS